LESTNDLDLQTLWALEDALINFQGAILLVTHDHSFLDRACNSILSFEEGEVVAYSDRHQVIIARKARASVKLLSVLEKKTKMAKLKKTLFKDSIAQEKAGIS
jgi:ATP-binding cassette, subfamily F, member 3